MVLVLDEPARSISKQSKEQTTALRSQVTPKKDVILALLVARAASQLGVKFKASSKCLIHSVLLERLVTGPRKLALVAVRSHAQESRGPRESLQ